MGGKHAENDCERALLTLKGLDGANVLMLVGKRSLLVCRKLLGTFKIGSSGEVLLPELVNILTDMIIVDQRLMKIGDGEVMDIVRVPTDDGLELQEEPFLGDETSWGDIR